MNKEEAKSLIDDFVEDRKRRYSKDKNLDLERDYNIEDSHKRGYHGRELLELLQNVDDAVESLYKNHKSLKPETVNAEISFINGTLCVSNNGTTFNEDTIIRLFVGDASSKDDSYIGKKGTGFRSVLNWAERIRIYSGDFSIQFSEAKAAEIFSELQKNNNYVCELAKSKPDLRYPIFSAPEWIPYKNTGFDTTIEIDVNEELNKDSYSVAEQIKELDENILLFLPNITQINIKTNDFHKVIRKESVEGNNNLIKIIKEENKKQIESIYYYFSNEGNEPLIEDIRDYKNIKKIKLAVAIPEEYKEQKYLYSYFPIKNTKSPFPALLNATFDLDSHRDSIPVNTTNTNVLAELIKFYVTTVVTYFTKAEFGDYALRLLIPDNFIDSDSWKFNNSIEKLDCEQIYLDSIKSARIFCTVNNEFISSNDEPLYLDKKFPECFKGKYFSHLIRFTEAYDNTNVANFVSCLCHSLMSSNNLLEAINKSDFTIKQRIETFDWWLRHYSQSKLLPNLIRCNRKDSQWVSYDTMCMYNPDFIIPNIPAWAKIVQLDIEDENELIEYFTLNRKDELLKYVKDATKDPKRPKRLLYRLINQSGLFRLREYSKNNILNPINASIDGNYSRAIEFVQFLWELNNSQEDTDDDDDIREDKQFYFFPAEDRNVYKADELYYGSNYGNTIGETLFKGTSVKKITSLSEFGISDEYKNEFISFLRTNGVKDTPVIQKGSPRYLKKEYEAIIKPLCNNFREFDKISVRFINNIEQILDTQQTKDILSWIVVGNVHNYVVASYETDAEIKYYHPGSKSGYPDQLWDTSKVKNYLQFVFQKSKWFDFNGEKVSPEECLISNDKVIKKFYKYTLSENEIKDMAREINCDVSLLTSTLISIGMCEDIVSLPSNDFYGILLEFDKYTEEIRDLYTTIYDQVIEKKSIFGESANKKLFKLNGKVLAKNRLGVEDLVINNKVFFANTAVLNLKNEFLLNTRAKNGSDDLAFEVFNVKKFKEKYTVQAPDFHEKNSILQKEFKEQLLPIVIALRPVEKDKNRCKNINLIFVKDITVLEDGKEIENIEPYTLLREGRNWYMLIPQDEKINREKISVLFEQFFNIYFNVPSEALINKIGEFYRALGTNTIDFLLNKYGIRPDEIKKAKKLLFGGVKQEFISFIKEHGLNYSNDIANRIQAIDLDQLTIDDIDDIKYLIKSTGINSTDFFKICNNSSYAIVNQFNKNQLINFVALNEKRIKTLMYQYFIENQLEKKNFLAELNKYEIELYLDEFVFNDLYFSAEKFALMKFANLDISNIDIELIYKNNLIELKNKITDFDDDYLNNINNQSLLYFGCFDELLNNYQNFLENKKKMPHENDGQQNSGNEPEINGNLLPAEPPKRKPNKVFGGNKNGAAGGNTRNLITQGDLAEKEVVSKLEEKLIPEINDFFDGKEYSVYWKSSAATRVRGLPGDDTIGYDIELIGNNKILYLEVKSTTKAECSFTLSENEYAKAIDKKHQYWVIFFSGYGSKPKISVIKNWYDSNYFDLRYGEYHFYYKGQIPSIGEK